MDIYNRSIGDRIDWLVELSRRYAQEFGSPESYLSRERYLARHPTAIMVLKCMDGRINIPIATNTPLGVMQPFRNLGGMFDLGWPYLGEVLANYVHGVVSQGRRVLALITYHFSQGSPQRGCAGFNYDTAAAIDHTSQIKRQMEYIFGAAHQTVYPLVCGYETDEDALILHGENGETLKVAELGEADKPLLLPRLEALFPHMPQQVRHDLLPLIAGNIDHITAVRGMARQLDIEHREWIICVGRGFDFLRMPNVALIIGPYSPDLADPIKKAAGIIRANMEHGRIPDDGFLLLASAPYHEVGVDRARAELKSRFLSQFAAGVVASEFPELHRKMFARTAVLDWRSRTLRLLAEGGGAP